MKCVCAVDTIAADCILLGTHQYSCALTGFHTEGGGGAQGFPLPSESSPPPPPRILKVYVQFYMALWYTMKNS